MTESSKGRADSPIPCEIRVKGGLDARWANWFDGLSLRTDDGTTVLYGTVVDQTALYGVLRKLRDLGLPLLSVSPVVIDPTASSPDVTC